MFTSNFARVKRLPPDLVPVSIAVGPPRWFKGRQCLALAPTRTMLKMARPDYDRLYDEILAKLDPRAIYNELGENAVLLCWETPGLPGTPKSWCHRRRASEWMENALGIVIPEFGFERHEIAPYAELLP